MRTALLLMLFVFSASLARARTEPLEEGISPNRRYQVQVAQRGASPQITYDLIRRGDGALLRRFASSYQPEEGEMPDWSWNHSARATIAWSPNIHYVSIDEEVHHYVGKVLLAEMTH